MTRQWVSAAALLVICIAFTGGAPAQEVPPAGQVKDKTLGNCRATGGRRTIVNFLHGRPGYR